MAESMQKVVKAERRGVHYAWMICVGCVFLMFSITGLSINVASIYQPYYIAQNGLTNAQGSSMTMVRSCFSLLSVVLAHQYYRRVRLRIGVVIACLLNGASFICFANAHSLPMFYLASALVGLAHGFGSMIPISILIDRWFSDRRAFALSLCASGSGLATILAPPLLERVIGGYGVRTSLLMEALLVFAISVFLAIVIQGSPKGKGLFPYRVPGIGRAGTRRLYVARHLLLTRGERGVVFAALFLFGLVVTPGTSHLAVHFVTAGYDARWVTLAISLFGFSLTFGQYAYGYITDRIGTYRSNYLFLGGQAVGWLCVGLACDGAVAQLVWGILLVGAGLPTSAVGVSLWAADFSTADNYDVTVERYVVITMTGGLVGATLPGVIADLAGSYGPVFLLYGLLVGVLLVLLQGIYRRHREQ